MENYSYIMQIKLLSHPFMHMENFQWNMQNNPQPEKKNVIITKYLICDC